MEDHIHILKRKIEYKQIFQVILGIIIYTILIVAFYFGWHEGIIQEFIHEAGFIAPLLYITVASGKAIFPIIPGEVLIITGVVLFGPIWGLSYALLGLTLGSTAAFFLARSLGRRWVKWLLGEKNYHRINDLSGDKTIFTFFLVYLTPGTPDDFVTYIAGLTSIKYWQFIAICIIGRLPSYIIAVIGGVSLKTLDYRLMFFWWGVMFVLVGCLYLYKKYFLDKKLKDISKK